MLITVALVNLERTLKSTVREPERTVNVSPSRRGWPRAEKYGLRKASERSSVSPSTVSSIGATRTLLPSQT